MSAFSAAASDEDGDTIKQLRAAIEQARNWIAEHPDRRPISAGRMVAIFTNALADAPQRQDHTAQHLNMVPEGWKPVPVEPTNEMVRAWLDTYEGNIQTVYRAMLAAAPQPPTVKDSLTTRPQVEQEPVASGWSVFNSGAEVASGLSLSDAIEYLNYSDRLDRRWCAVCVIDKSNPPTFVSPQPKRGPLTREEIAIIAAACGGLASDFVVSVARTIERAHGIGGEA